MVSIKYITEDETVFENYDEAILHEKYCEEFQKLADHLETLGYDPEVRFLEEILRYIVHNISRLNSKFTKEILDAPT